MFTRAGMANYSRMIVALLILIVLILLFGRGIVLAAIVLGGLWLFAQIAPSHSAEQMHAAQFLAGPTATTFSTCRRQT